MPIKIETDPATGIRSYTATGELTFAEVHETLRTVYEDVNFQPDAHVLWDLREARTNELSPEEVDRLADFVGQYWGTGGKSKAAFVTSRDVDFGMARMYEQMLAIRSTSVVKVFRDLDEARRWLLADAESSGA